MTKTTKRETLASLRLELYKAKANDIAGLSKACAAIRKCGKDKYMASGVIIEIRDLSGNLITPPFLVGDGLSQESIAALGVDIQATYQARLLYNKLPSQ